MASSVLLCSLLLMFCVGTVLSAVTNREENPVNEVYVENLHYDVNMAGQLTEENIEMNHEENYVRVTTPALGKSQAMVLIHDYSLGLTLIKMNGRCFMLDEYDDIPRMEHWSNLNLNMEGGVVQAGDTDGYRNHNYRIVPFALDRANLPEVMLGECEEIDLMVLQNNTVGEKAKKELDAMGDTPFIMGTVYIPGVLQDQKQLNVPEYAKSRTKRRVAPLPVVYHCHPRAPLA